MVKLEVLNLQLLRKINYTTSILQLICPPFKNTCFKEKFKEKSNNFEMQYISCYSRCIVFHFLTDGRPFTKQEWIAWFDRKYFQMQSLKKKDKHGKYCVEETVESIVHILFGKNMEIIIYMSFLMTQWTSLHDSTTHRDLYVIALSRFDIIKNICIISFLSVL